MAHSPLEHSMDQKEWHLFDALFGGISIHLPSIPLPFGYELQITKFMILQIIACGVIIAIYVPLARRIQNGEPATGWFWNSFEVLLTFIRDQVAKPCIGEKDADTFVPFLWTLFLFILINNLLGMIPFFGSATGSIMVTGALALVAFMVIQGSAMVRFGPVGYFTVQFPHTGLPFPFGLLLGVMILVIELVGHLIKAFVLAVRLFANIFAGHTVLAFIMSFIVMAKNAAPLLWGGITVASILGVTAISLLELFVAFLQAYIFVFLTSLFLGMGLHPEH